MNKSRDSIVGLFVLVSLGLLSIMIVTFSNYDYLKKTYPLSVEFRIVNGLLAGAPVRYAGLEIGRVLTMDLKQRHKACSVIVHMQIEEGIQVHKEDKAVITSLGIMGDKYIEIIPNEQSTEVLPSGGLMQGETPVLLTELLEQGKNVIENFSVTLDKVVDDDSRIALKNIILNLNELTGKETQDKLGSILRNLDEITGDETKEKIHASLDTLHKTATDLQGALRAIDEKRINAIFEDIDAVILQNGPVFETVLSSLARLSKSVEDITMEIQMGDGNLHKLIYKKDLYDDLLEFVQNLKKRGIFYKDKSSRDRDTDRGNRGVMYP